MDKRSYHLYLPKITTIIVIVTAYKKDTNLLSENKWCLYYYVDIVNMFIKDHKAPKDPC